MRQPIELGDAGSHYYMTTCGSDVIISRVTLANVRLTAMPVSCTAEAHVGMSRGAAAAAHTAGQQREICSRRDTALVLFGPGASAPDPKPGRDSFSD